MSKNPATTLISAPQRSLRFFKEAREELRKVSWPSRELTVRYTLIVIISSLAMGLLIGGLDFLFSKAIQNFI